MSTKVQLDRKKMMYIRRKMDRNNTTMHFKKLKENTEYFYNLEMISQVWDTYL